jgi:hypothetical protein
MSALGLLAGLLVGAAAAFGVVRLIQRRGDGGFDLGAVSDQWRAQQRGNPDDSSFS